MTAHVALFAAGPVQGRIVLVTGGAGAVGLYAVQLAKWAGATVIATVSSPEKSARAKAGGADFTINYKREDVAEQVREITGGEGVDHVVEVDFGGNLAQTVRALKPNGSIAYYASKGDPTPVLTAGELMRKNLTVRGVLLPTSRTKPGAEPRPTSPAGSRRGRASWPWPGPGRSTTSPWRTRRWSEGTRPGRWWWRWAEAAAATWSPSPSCGRRWPEGVG